MSIKALTWAFDQTTGSPSAKVILLCLADFADENGVSYPRQATIAARTEQSVDTIQRRLKDLEARGLVEREQQINADRWRVADRYYLMMPGSRRRSKIAGSADAADCGSRYRNDAVADAAHVRPQEEPSIEPSTKPFPPTPHSGGPPAEPEASPKASRRAEGDRIVSAAFDLWNAFATQHGLGRVEIQSETRRRRMAKRLAEIGGIDRFEVALKQVLADDFLMGRVQPRDGNQPYRLSIEGLLSTGSGMGDVLARLIEKAREPVREAKTKAGKPGSAPPPVDWWKNPESADAARRGSEEGWEEFVRRWANGTWPVEYLGPLPGTPECLVPEPIVKKLNLIERYGGAK